MLTLPGGQLTGQFFDAFGQKNENAPKRQAINGGTGEYNGARGQFVVGKETTARTPFVIELLR